MRAQYKQITSYSSVFCDCLSFSLCLPFDHHSALCGFLEYMYSLVAEKSNFFRVFIFCLLERKTLSFVGILSYCRMVCIANSCASYEFQGIKRAFVFFLNIILILFGFRMRTLLTKVTVRENSVFRRHLYRYSQNWGGTRKVTRLTYRAEK